MGVYHPRLQAEGDKLPIVILKADKLFMYEYKTIYFCFINSVDN